VNKNQKAVKGL